MQYIIINKQMPGGNWNQNNPNSIQKSDFEEIRAALPDVDRSKVKIGIGVVISCLNSTSDEMLCSFLERFLSFAEETNTPVVMQLDVANWWDTRPDLWNWWDPTQPGFDPLNRENVEWTGWTSDQAIKVAWRNWGRKIQLKPPPNLMSKRYRNAWHEKMNLIMPIILKWWKALPSFKQDLLVGIKVGHESSIGVNAWYYPNGEDQDYLLDTSDILSRGVSQIGYAALKTAGIRSSGNIIEEDLYEVVRRHLEDLSHKVSDYGIPRDRLFTHSGGWKNGELLYDAAFNRYSCPGWSFYDRADDPRKDIGIQRVIAKMDSPYWAAVEWFLIDNHEYDKWFDALSNTLEDQRCRYVCIYNWEGFKSYNEILTAIRRMLELRI